MILQLNIFISHQLHHIQLRQHDMRGFPLRWNRYVDRITSRQITRSQRDTMFLYKSFVLEMTSMVFNIISTYHMSFIVLLCLVILETGKAKIKAFQNWGKVEKFVKTSSGVRNQETVSYFSFEAHSNTLTHNIDWEHSVKPQSKLRFSIRFE